MDSPYRYFNPAMRHRIDSTILHMVFTMLIFCVLFFFTTSTNAAELTRPLPDEGATKVMAGIYIIDIDGIDTANQSFDANVYLQYRWHDSRLSHEGPGPITLPLELVWNPQVQIVNQQRTWPTFPEIVTVSPDGEVFYRQRVWGSFSQPLKLHDFPFDMQSFTVRLAAAGYTPEEVEFVSDQEKQSGIAEELSVADWKVTDWVAKPAPYAPIPGSESNGTLPGYVFTFTADRLDAYFVIKVIIPLVLIVAMSWVVFWMEPKEVGSNVGISITTMLTLIAYRFAVDTSLPKLPYLTRLDYFIMASTVLVFLSLIQAVITSWLAKKGKLKSAVWLNRVCRVAFPAVFLGIAIKTLGMEHLF